MPQHLQSERIAVLALLVFASLLGGCAELLVVATVPIVVGGARVAANPDLVLIPKEETHRETLKYPTPTVYSALTRTAERNGRRIIDSNPAEYTIRVSYPFSFLTNNWGGVITIACLQEGSDTKITIIGSGRDPNYRVKKIGDEILSEMRIALEQLPRSSSP
jgi:hypothetical protein